jgi:hypothetical protein
MQRSEVLAAELEYWCGCAKEEDEGGNEREMIKTPILIYKGVDTRQARESRRLKSSCGYMDASVFGMFIKISIN